mmetsp:Transcript_19565/g.45414  ORF Transcript_19565/g.45414 Transcript_19565/m.45414 type:complete len:343 (+) Transcript_19565:887-1915(+)
MRGSPRVPTSPRRRTGVFSTSLLCASSSFRSCPPSSPVRPLRGYSSSCSSHSLPSHSGVSRATYSRESSSWWMKIGTYDRRFASLSQANTSDPHGFPCSKYPESDHTRRISSRTVVSTLVPHSDTTSWDSEACTPWLRITSSTTCLTERASTASTLSSRSPSCRRMCPASALVALLGSSESLASLKKGNVLKPPPSAACPIITGSTAWMAAPGSWRSASAMISSRRTLSTWSYPSTPMRLSSPREPMSSSVHERRGTNTMHATNPVTKPESQLCPSCRQSLSRKTLASSFRKGTACLAPSGQSPHPCRGICSCCVLSMESARIFSARRSLSPFPSGPSVATR